MAKPSESDIAYVAGIIDGEGCIGIYRASRARSGHSLLIKVSMTEPHAIQLLIDSFGARANPYTNKFGVVYRAVYTGERAYKFLQLIVKYLRVKRAQAEAAMEFYTACMGRKGHVLSDDDVAVRAFYEHKLKAMKRRGVSHR